MRVAHQRLCTAGFPTGSISSTAATCQSDIKRWQRCHPALLAKLSVMFFQLFKAPPRTWRLSRTQDLDMIDLDIVLVFERIHPDSPTNTRSWKDKSCPICLSLAISTRPKTQADVTGVLSWGSLTSRRGEEIRIEPKHLQPLQCR